MRKNSTIKILVADDHSLFRSGIIKLLKDNTGIYILAEAKNGLELIKKYFEVLPDIALVDIAMPEMSGLEAVARIRKKDPNVKALFLSMYDTDEYIYKVLKTGGMGLINKNILEGELAYAIEQVYKGEKYFRGMWTTLTIEDFIRDFESHHSVDFIHSPEVNFREEQILKFLNEGLSSKDMAGRLDLSKKTIDFYRSNLMRKFELKTSADLVRFATRYFDADGRKTKPDTPS